jgi:DNA-binding beta-propeller fold protein YncE
LNFEVKELTHYNMNLYVGSRGYDQVYVIDTDSDAIIDTLTGFTSVPVNRYETNIFEVKPPIFPMVWSVC